MSFTTRPELRGTFGMVASTHWLASAAGMAVLERGGNAFDAAVATGLTLQVVEPHLNGPGGEVPALLWPVSRGEPIALCGQGVAPAAATIERYRELGHEPRPRHRRPRRVRARRLRRLAAPARALRHLATRGRARVRDRLRRGRLPGRGRDPRHDRPHRGAAAAPGRARPSSTCRRPGSARSSATRRSPRPTSGSSTSLAAAPARRRSSRRGAPSTRGSSPRRSTASSPPRAVF